MWAREGGFLDLEGVEQSVGVPRVEHTRDRQREIDQLAVGRAYPQRPLAPAVRRPTRCSDDLGRPPLMKAAREELLDLAQDRCFRRTVLACH